MRILFALNHPAHYHLFKHPFSILKRHDHDTVFVIKNKDILAQLLKSEKVPYHMLTEKRVGNNKMAVLAKGVVDILASLVFTAFNVWRQEITDADEHVFHQLHLRRVAGRHAR